MFSILENGGQKVNSQVNGATSTLTSTQGETLWVEGLVPGIDFCNHGMVEKFANIIIEANSYIYF